MEHWLALVGAWLFGGLCVWIVMRSSANRENAFQRSARECAERRC